MKFISFKSQCAFEVGDEVKIILDEKLKEYSSDNFIVVDILGIHSVTYLTVKFMAVLKNKIYEEFTKKPVEEIIRIKNIEL